MTPSTLKEAQGYSFEYKKSCAFYLENESAIYILKDYFYILLGTHAKPLINYYSPDINLEYSRYLIEIEEDIGN